MLGAWEEEKESEVAIFITQPLPWRVAVDSLCPLAPGAQLWSIAYHLF